jgi:DNA mismatch endonuclease, patch repair protein
MIHRVPDRFDTETRRQIMRSVRNKNTKPERIVRSALHRAGFRFRLHRADLPGTPDIVLPKYRSVIFVHGCLWHGHACPRGKLPVQNHDFWAAKVSRNRARDAAAREALKALGWRVIVVWQCQVSSALRLEQTTRELITLITAPARTGEIAAEPTVRYGVRPT